MLEPFLLPPGGEREKGITRTQLKKKTTLPLQPEWPKITRASNMPTFLEANLSFSNYVGTFTFGNRQHPAASSYTDATVASQAPNVGHTPSLSFFQTMLVIFQRVRGEVANPSSCSLCTL